MGKESCAGVSRSEIKRVRRKSDNAKDCCRVLLRADSKVKETEHRAVGRIAQLTVSPKGWFAKARWHAKDIGGTRSNIGQFRCTSGQHNAGGTGFRCEDTAKLLFNHSKDAIGAFRGYLLNRVAWQHAVADREVTVKPYHYILILGCGRATPETQFQLFCLVGGYSQANAEIFREMAAAHRQYAGHACATVAIECKIRRATADVDHENTVLAIIG